MIYYNIYIIVIQKKLSLSYITHTHTDDNMGRYKGYDKKDNCEKCKAKGGLEIHHKIPRAFGGTDNPENLMTFCWPCHFNARFGDFPSADIADKLDFLDIIILNKFYVDNRPWIFPELYKEMKRENNIKLCREGFRKRIRNLSRYGFLKECGGNPRIYSVHYRSRDLILEIMKAFFEIHGLERIGENNAKI